MSLSQSEIQQALRVRRAVDEYFQATTENMVQAKQLMPHFIQKGIFNQDHREGLPIRDLLRRLHEEDQLKLIPQVHFEQKAVNRNWYFIRKG